MRNILAIDIGNTNITVGLFKGRKLVKKEKIPTSAHSLYKRIARYPADEIIISSVVPLALARIVCELNKHSKRMITILGRDTLVPIKNLYRNKKEVGQDRLVNAFGARAIYGSPAVIIDFGTAITFDIISKNGSYLGGLILPGIEMGLKSLHEKTALLPRVELRPVKNIIGKDTVSSMRGGILFGYGAMCDSLVSKYKGLMGSGVKIIATGGNAKLIKKYAHSIQIVDEDLTLKSLSLIRPK